MLKVRGKRLTEYLGSSLSGPHSAHGKNFYYARRAAFNPLFFGILLVFLCLELAQRNSMGITAAVACVIWISYHRIRLRGIARGVQLRRRAPDRATEQDEIEIHFEIDNTSAFPLEDIVVTDRFSGSGEAQTSVWIPARIPRFSTHAGSYKKKCDSGMGDFAFGPLSVTLRDPMGFWEFTVSEDKVSPIRVEPKLVTIPELPFSGSTESHQFGLYDIATVGSSVNFIGIREYTRGDSLRHVAWKLSARLSNLLVKEFEKSVNTEISILFDMDARSHLGRKNASTWEYAKDFTLSLLAREANTGNSLQLLSQKTFFPMGKGPQHVHLLTKTIASLLPELPEKKPGEEAPNLVQKYATVIPTGSTVVYVGPVFSPETVGVLASLETLVWQNVQVLAVLIDGRSFLKGEIQGPLRTAMEIRGENAGELLKAAVLRLGKAGITSYVLHRGGDMASELLNPRLAHPLATMSRPI